MAGWAYCRTYTAAAPARTKDLTACDDGYLLQFVLRC
jgi:hypothetical protein